jgi:hypothetical protein
MPKAQQSQFRVGHLALSYTDPDFYRAVVMNKIYLDQTLFILRIYQ